MFSPMLPAFGGGPQKIQRWTRKKRNKVRLLAQKEAKRAAKMAAKREAFAAHRSTRGLGIFEGCDPERTLALLGEEV